MQRLSLLSPTATASFAGALAAYGVLRALSTVLESIHGLPHLYAQVQTQGACKLPLELFTRSPCQPSQLPPSVNSTVLISSNIILILFLTNSD